MKNLGKVCKILNKHESNHPIIYTGGLRKIHSTNSKHKRRQNLNIFLMMTERQYTDIYIHLIKSYFKGGPH